MGIKTSNPAPYGSRIEVSPCCLLLYSYRLGESCSHVAAILFKIEAAVRLGYTTRACTDEACKWNRSFTQKVKPSTIADIKLYREEIIKSSPADNTDLGMDCVNNCADNDLITPERETFIQQLASAGLNRPPVCLSLFDSTCFLFKSRLPISTVTEPCLPKTLRSLYDINLYACTDEELQTACDNTDIVISASEVDLVERCTVEQSNSTTWFEQRAGRVTASSAYRILHSNLQSGCRSLVLSITNEVPCTLNVPAINYGKENEPRALSLFEQQLTDLHPGGILVRTGFRICSDHPWLGASLDSMLTCPCHGTVVTEVKCPFRFRDSSVSEMLETKGCCLLDNGELRKDHEYYCQIQIQMLVLNTKHAILLLYTNSLVIINISTDDEFIAHALSKLYSFWSSYVLPELLTRRLEQNSNDQQPLQPLTLYCYCQQPKDPNNSDGSHLFVKCYWQSCSFNGLVHIGCSTEKKISTKGTVVLQVLFKKHCQVICMIIIVILALCICVINLK